MLSTFPRDELFQISEDELLPTALSILNLGERPKVRVFLRFDKFDRFVSALVFLPRERYSGAVRGRIHALLATGVRRPHIGGDADARRRVAGARPLHRRAQRGSSPGRGRQGAGSRISAPRSAPGTTGSPRPCGWSMANSRACSLRRYANAFPGDYREAIAPSDAVADIGASKQCSGAKAAAEQSRPMSMALPGDAENALRLKLFVRGSFVPLSDCLPVFENLGLKVIAEQTFALSTAHGKRHEGARLAAQFPDDARGRQTGRYRARQAAAGRRVPRGVARRSRIRWVQPPDHRRRTGLARHHDPARRRQIPAPGRHQSQPGLCRKRVRQERRRLPSRLVELFRTLHDPELVPRYRRAQSGRRAHPREHSDARSPTFRPPTTTASSARRSRSSMRCCG